MRRVVDYCPYGSDKGSAQVERLEVVDKGQWGRWSKDEKLKIVLESLPGAAPSRGNNVAVSHFALIFGFLVQEAFNRDARWRPLCVRGRSGKPIKILWHDGLGMRLYAKRLERGRFLWPSPPDGVVTITPAQLGYLLESIDWRLPQRTLLPQAAG